MNAEEFVERGAAAIAMVYQEPMASLNPSNDVRDTCWSKCRCITNKCSDALRCHAGERCSSAYDSRMVSGIMRSHRPAFRWQQRES